jgi:uncharacterized protein DUF1360
VNPWLLIFLIFLATHRGTRLLVADKLPLIAVPRQWLITKLDPRDEKTGKRTEPAPLGAFGRALAYLVTCEWCTSAYVGAAIVWATIHWIDVPAPYLVWAAASSVTGLLAAAEGWGEQRFRLNLARMWLAHDDMEKRGYKMPEEEE